MGVTTIRLPVLILLTKYILKCKHVCSIILASSLCTSWGTNDQDKSCRFLCVAHCKHHSVCFSPCLRRCILITPTSSTLLLQRNCCRCLLLTAHRPTWGSDAQQSCFCLTWSVQVAVFCCSCTERSSHSSLRWMAMLIFSDLLDIVHPWRYLLVLVLHMWHFKMVRLPYCPLYRGPYCRGSL